MQDTVPGLVSTIIPCFNRPQMVREAVQSVLGQTYRPIEIIVVDDGSTDDTPATVQQLVDTYPEIVRLIRKSNSGAGPTREAGRQVARGEYIQYLDSDDLLRPQKFEKQVAALKANPQCDAAYGWICVHKLNTPPSNKPYKASGEKRGTLFPWLLADRWWNTDAPLFRRRLCDEIGPWSDLRWSQDWEMDGRVAALGTKLAYVADWMCDERHHTTGRQTDTADWVRDPVRLRSRTKFLSMMLQHAIRGNVSAESPERMHFTRWMFTTARHAAAAGLSAEARELLQLTHRSASGNPKSLKGVRAFEILSGLLGLASAGRIAFYLEQLRKTPSRLTIQESHAKAVQ